MKNNLYIIGCPRSMTTLIYMVVCASLNKGRKDINISWGEYLNSQRKMLPLSALHQKYISKEHQFWTDDAREEQIKLLHDIHKSKEMIILKDVTFPNIVCDFVRSVNAKTLIIKKDIPLIAYSCAKLGWFYPNNVLIHHKEDDKYTRLIKSLKFMYDNHFDRLAKGENVRVIDVDEVLKNQNILWDALSSLGYKPKRIVIGDEIKNKSKVVEAYKDTELYKKLKGIYNNV